MSEIACHLAIDRQRNPRTKPDLEPSDEIVLHDAVLPCGASAAASSEPGLLPCTADKQGACPPALPLCAAKPGSSGSHSVPGSWQSRGSVLATQSIPYGGFCSDTFHDL